MVALDYLKSTTTQYYLVSCASCTIRFYLPDLKYDRCKERGEGFYCPNGHSSVFSETEIGRLKKELETEQKKLKWAQQSRDYYQERSRTLEKSRAAVRGQLTRVKNRVKHGLCPCCNRTFQNVARHMKTKHPDFKPWEHEETK